MSSSDGKIHRKDAGEAKPRRKERDVEEKHDKAKVKERDVEEKRGKAKIAAPKKAEIVAPAQATRRKRFQPTSYHVYIDRILKSDVHPDMGISEEGRILVNGLLNFR